MTVGVLIQPLRIRRGSDELIRGCCSTGFSQKRFEQFRCDDPAATMFAAAQARNRAVFRPGVVDRQLFARSNVAEGFEPHFNPKRRVGVLVIQAARGTVGPLHGLVPAHIVVPFLRGNVIHKLAVRFAGMVQEAKRCRRFERKPAARVDAVAGRIFHVGKNAAANPPDFPVASQFPRCEHAQTAGRSVNANRLGEMPDEVRVMPLDDIVKLRIGNVTGKKREMIAGLRNHGNPWFVCESLTPAKTKFQSLGIQLMPPNSNPRPT